VCRNIKTLYHLDPPATDDEIRASALQYVRKVSGFVHPSAVNSDAFDAAIEEVAATSRRLLDSLITHAPVREREANRAAG
jgi:hypothetical protein